MSSPEELFVNPCSGNFFLNHGYYYAVGNTQAVDLTEGCKVPPHAEFLLLGCGDIRHILKTVHEVNKLDSPKSLSFHLNDMDDVLLARNAVLLKMVNTINPSQREDVEFVWNVWYNVQLSEQHYDRLQAILTDVLESPMETLTFETEVCSAAIKKVVKYWLRQTFKCHDILQQREEFMCRKVKANNPHMTDVNMETAVFATSTEMVKDEIMTYLKTGNTKGSASGRTNPTLVCPHVKGWRVHPGCSAYRAFNGLISDQKLSITENCMIQLQSLLKSWKEYMEKAKIKVSVWLEDALALVNLKLPPEKKFHFINTSNLSDHIGLLNVLLSCSKRLKRSGILSVQTMHLQDHKSIDAYLDYMIGIPAQFFPTFLGLHMAENFELGTSKFPDHNFHSTRWVAAEQASPRINFQGSPEIQQVFESIVKKCLNLFDPSLALKTSVKTPLTLVYLIHQLSANSEEGARLLLEIVERCLPERITQYGTKFSPLQMEWNMLKLYHFQSEVHDSESLVKIEIPVIDAEPSFLPSRSPAGVDITHKAVILNHVSEQREFITGRYPSPWHVLSLLHFNYRSNTVSCILPKAVYESLGKTTHIMFYCETGRPSNIMTTGLLKDIAKYTTLEVMSAVPVRKQQKTPVTSDQNIKVNVFESKNYFTLLVKAIEVDTIHQPFELIEDVKDKRIIILRIFPSLLRMTWNVPFEMNIHLTCPVDLPESNAYLQQDTVTILKNDMLTEGLSNLVHRKMALPSYPRFSRDIESLAHFLECMFTQTDRNHRQDPSIYSDTLFEVKETLQKMLLWALEKPQIRSYGLLREDRVEGQMCGHFPEDIFIGVKNLHSVQGVPTLDIVWIDYDNYRQLADTVKYGHTRVVRNEKNISLDGVVPHPQKELCDAGDLGIKVSGKGANSFNQADIFKKFGDYALHVIDISSKEGRLMKQLLRANTRRTVQESETPGSPQWHFNSFIQPVYTIEPENTIMKHLLTEEGRVEAMKQNQDSQKKVESEKSLETNKCQCCGVSSPDLKKCTRCKSVYYCNKVCQKRDWKERHRNTCRPAS